MASCKDCIHYSVFGYVEFQDLECKQFKPTADVVEVKHGYWKRGQWVDDYNAGGYYLAECNLCGCTQEKASNFCPNCGAKMDGKDINVPTNGRRDT